MLTILVQAYDKNTQTIIWSPIFNCLFFEV